MEARSSSPNVPAIAPSVSFAELLQHLSQAHQDELQGLHNENVELRCRLAFVQEKAQRWPEVEACREPPVLGADAGTSGYRRCSELSAPPVFQEEYEEDEPKIDPAGLCRHLPEAESPPLDCLSPTSSPRNPHYHRQVVENTSTGAKGPRLLRQAPASLSEDISGTISAAPEEFTEDARSPVPQTNGLRSSPLAAAAAAASSWTSLLTPRRAQKAISQMTRQPSHHEPHLPFSKRQSLAGPKRRGDFVKGVYFETTVWVLIAVSTIAMAFEMQYQGIDLGHTLQYPGSTHRAAKAWPGASMAFSILEWVFGLLFTIELILKFLAFRWKFACGKDGGWNLLDLCIVAAWWIWKADTLSTGEIFPFQLNPQLLRIFRLGRLLRLLKLVRKFSTFDSLHVMTTAMRGSAHVFGWACLLLFLFQTMLALFLTGIIQQVYLEADSQDMVKRREVYEYFGTFTRSFLSMFELTLANWPPVARILTENISEWWTVFAILHKLTIGFALVGIINGVFMQETFKVASMDDKIMLRQKQAAKDVHAKKMQALFTHLDTSRDGKLDQNEFRQIVRDKQLRDWLSAQDLTVNDADSLFEMIAGGDGEITADELIAGVARLKGNAMMLDLMVLTQQLLEFRNIFRAIAGFEPDAMPSRSVPLSEAVRSKRVLATPLSSRSVNRNPTA